MSSRGDFRRAVDAALGADVPQHGATLHDWLAPTQETRVEQIPVDEIADPEWRSPVDVADPSYRALKASVRASGILQPLLVRRLDDGGLQVVSGMRRLRAARDTALEAVPATIRELSDVQAIVGTWDAVVREGTTADRRDAIERRLLGGGLPSADVTGLLASLALVEGVASAAAGVVAPPAEPARRPSSQRPAPLAPARKAAVAAAAPPPAAPPRPVASPKPVTKPEPAVDEAVADPAPMVEVIAKAAARPSPRKASPRSAEAVAAPDARREEARPAEQPREQTDGTGEVGAPGASSPVSPGFVAKRPAPRVEPAPSRREPEPAAAATPAPSPPADEPAPVTAQSSSAPASTPAIAPQTAEEASAVEPVEPVELVDAAAAAETESPVESDTPVVPPQPPWAWSSSPSPKRTVGALPPVAEPTPVQEPVWPRPATDASPAAPAPRGRAEDRVDPPWPSAPAARVDLEPPWPQVEPAAPPDLLPVEVPEPEAHTAAAPALPPLTAPAPAQEQSIPESSSMAPPPGAVPAADPAGVPSRPDLPGTSSPVLPIDAPPTAAAAALHVISIALPRATPPGDDGGPAEPVVVAPRPGQLVRAVDDHAVTALPEPAAHAALVSTLADWRTGATVGTFVFVLCVVYIIFIVLLGSTTLLVPALVVALLGAAAAVVSMARSRRAL